MSEKLEAALGLNPEEMREALMLEGQAIYNREQIQRLPQAIGARVLWPHNGVIWERVGDNKWVVPDQQGPENDPTGYFEGRTWPSSHIASIGWQALQ